MNIGNYIFGPFQGHLNYTVHTLCYHEEEGIINHILR